VSSWSALVGWCLGSLGGPPGGRPGWANCELYLPPTPSPGLWQVSVLQSAAVAFGSGWSCSLAVGSGDLQNTPNTPRTPPEHHQNPPEHPQSTQNTPRTLPEHRQNNPRTSPEHSLNTPKTPPTPSPRLWQRYPQTGATLQVCSLVVRLCCVCIAVGSFWLG
jgi:hypothetical protein